MLIVEFAGDEIGGVFHRTKADGEVKTYIQRVYDAVIKRDGQLQMRLAFCHVHQHRHHHRAAKSRRQIDPHGACGFSELRTQRHFCHLQRFKCTLAARQIGLALSSQTYLTRGAMK